jgi:TPR repeat protein
MKRWLLSIAALCAIIAVFFYYKTNNTDIRIEKANTENTTSDLKATDADDYNEEKISAIPAKAKLAFLRPTPKIIIGNALQNISQYEAAASTGDGEAAFIIFQVLYECSLQAKKLGGMGKIDCTGVSSEQIANAEKFLKIGAEAGHLEAQLSYPGVASMRYMKVEDIARNTTEFQQFKNDSMRYLSSAASSGNVDAMLGISNAYREGLITEKNNIRAYAYMHAANLSGLSSTPTNALIRLNNEMTPDEVQQATSMGNSIYKQCCN